MRQNPRSNFRSYSLYCVWQSVPLHLIIDICFGYDYQYILPKIEVFSEKKSLPVLLSPVVLSFEPLMMIDRKIPDI